MLFLASTAWGHKMNPTLIYWSCALLVVFALQWPPLWGLVPFVVGAIIYKARKNKRARENAKRLPADVATASSIPADKMFAQPVKTEEPQETQTAPVADGQIYDPFFEVPEVYRHHTDWSQYDAPTFTRRKLVMPTPTPAATSASVTPAYPELALPAPEENAPVEGGNFSFI